MKFKIKYWYGFEEKYKNIGLMSYNEKELIPLSEYDKLSNIVCSDCNKKLSNDEIKIHRYTGMERKEAKELFKKDKDSYGKPRSIMSKIDKIFNEFEEESLQIPDIRNKLSPITNLIALIERDQWELAEDQIEQCKKSINYLANRAVYYLPPKFVKLNECALRHNNKTKMYYRDAGCWEVGYKKVDDKLYSIDIYEGHSILDNTELIPCTEKEWLKDNEGYIPEKY